jgi:lipopolysaccharide biosynthesis regulator YciM
MAIRLEPELAPRATRLLAATASDALEVERFLRDQIATHPSSEAPFELALALHLKEESSADRAIAQLRELVDRKPRFWEARKELGALLLAQNREEELRAEYRDILATLGQPAMGFVCSVCRQKLPGHLFRCPSCESWDTVLRE